MKYPLHPVWKILLFPFSFLYGLTVGVRNMLYDIDLLSVHEFDLPVISVGNITVGGTGKTPHVEYLIRLLRSNSHVAVLSRGYKRKTRGFVTAGEKTTVYEIGDEPFQIHKKFPEITVIVDEKRARALKKIEEEREDIQVVLLDDAFQHRPVKPGLSVLLIDYNICLSKELYLPAGRMRESRHEKKRADIVLFTKCPETLKPIEERIRVKQFNPYPYQHVYFTKVVYGNPVPVFSKGTEEWSMEKLVDNYQAPVLVVTGIASPDSFLQHIKKYAKNAEILSFSDHYRFKKKDIEKIGKILEKMPGERKSILTTEKDAMRLAGFYDFKFPFEERWFYIPIEVVMLQKSEKEDFENQIIKYVRDNQRYHRFHKE